MADIRERLQQAVAIQRDLVHAHKIAEADRQTEAAFRPVREAAEQMRVELAHLPDLSLKIEPHGVWMDLPDKHMWFSFDPAKQAFVGSELDSLWMEGGLREEHFEWATAEQCIDALLQAGARAILLAEAGSRIVPARE